MKTQKKHRRGSTGAMLAACLLGEFDIEERELLLIGFFVARKAKSGQRI